MRNSIVFFIMKEFVEVVGKRCSNLLLIVFIFISTFCVLGLSHGLIGLLNKDLDHPLNRWVELKPNTIGDGNLRDLVAELNKYVKRKGFDVTIDATEKNTRLFAGNKRLKSYVLNRDSELWPFFYNADLWKEDVRVIDFDRANKDYLGVYISRKLFDEKAELDSNNKLTLPVIYLKYGENGNSLTVPVLGVIPRMPPDIDIVNTPYLKNYLRKQDREDYFTIGFLYENNKEMEVLSVLKDIQKNEISKPRDWSKSCFPVRVTFIDKEFEYNEIDTILRNLSMKIGKGTPLFYHIERYDVSNALAMEKEMGEEYYGLCDHINFSFNSIDNADLFSDSIAAQIIGYSSLRGKPVNIDDYKLDVSDLKKIETYNLMNFFLNSIIWIILFLSSLSVGAFLYKLFNSHFDKIKLNIGVFKAYGMSQNFLTYSYTTILFFFTGIAYLISLLFLFFLDTCNIIENIGRYWLSNDEDADFFQLFNVSLFWFTSTLIVIIIVVIFRLQVTKFNRTPGDLIYNRE